MEVSCRHWALLEEWHLTKLQATVLLRAFSLKCLSKIKSLIFFPLAHSTYISDLKDVAIAMTSQYYRRRQSKEGNSNEAGCRSATRCPEGTVGMGCFVHEEHFLPLSEASPLLSWVRVWMPTTVLHSCLREHVALEDDPSQSSSNPPTKLLVGTCQKTLPMSLECVIISLEISMVIKPRSWGERRKTELSGSLNVSSLARSTPALLRYWQVDQNFFSPSFFKLDLNFYHL